MPAKKTATHETAAKVVPAKDAESLLPLAHKVLKASREGRDGLKAKLEEALAALHDVRVQDSRITSAMNVLGELLEESNVSAGKEDAVLRDITDYIDGTLTDPADPAA